MRLSQRPAAGQTFPGEPVSGTCIEALAKELIAIIRAEPTTGDPDREIIDGWAEKLGLSRWYRWKEAVSAMDALGALIEEGKLHEARPLLQKKLRLMPQNPVALYYLGLLARPAAAAGDRGPAPLIPGHSSKRSAVGIQAALS